MNGMLYNTKFPDETIKPYLAKNVTKNRLYQVDKDDYHRHLLEGILDHSKDGRAVEKKNQWLVSKRG